MGTTKNSCLTIKVRNRFPLTLHPPQYCYGGWAALSLGERENCRQSAGETDAMRAFKWQALLFPLPAERVRMRAVFDYVYGH
jgi:hypothetical protein